MARIPEKYSRPGGSVQVRIAGREPPSMGKVGRITNDARDVESGRRSRNKRRRPSERRSSRRQDAVLRRWLILGLVLAGGGLCGVLVWTLALQGSTSPQAGKNRSAPAAGAWAGTPPLEASEAIRMVSRMLEADSPGEFEPLLRKGEASGDGFLAWVRGFRRDNPDLPDPFWLGSFDSICAPVHFVMLRPPLGKPLMVTLTTDAENQWSIDFEATTGHCEPAFDEWVTGNAEHGMVRALGSEDFYFNGPFRDDETWACFSLSHPDHDSSIYGYCLRESVRYEAIMTILRRNQRATVAEKEVATRPEVFRVTLKLTRPEGGIGRQYEIEEVVSDDWVIGDTSLETLLRRREDVMR